jgi:sporulation protein YlmC with PRC-barrel domain
MKTNHIAAVSGMGMIVLVGALAAIAQQATEVNRTPGSQPGTAAANRDLGKLDDKTPGATIRASQLMGQNIKNASGENVGEVKDFVIDSTGKIRYVTVTYGGIVGVGSKWFAVPFEAFRVSRDPGDPNDKDDYVLTLNVTKQQLDGAEGFDDDNWPDFADTKFTQDLDRRYKVNRSSRNPTPPLR